MAGAAIGVVAAILSAQSFASAREAAASYLIQPGDSLSSIATATGVSLEKLIGWNSIKDPNVIIAGQTLSLNGTSTGDAGGSPAPGQYVVKAGDTLWAIAQANSVSVDDLVQQNSLNNADQLQVGQVLRLPVTAGPVQRVATAPTPKPKPSPTAPTATTTTRTTRTTSSLAQKVASEAQRVGGANAHVGVAAINLTTGDKVSSHADDEFPSASVMKLPILVELERQIAAGQLSWTDNLRADVSAMIAISDNTAANEIATAIHPQSVNDTMARMGLGSTHFLNLFSDARSTQSPGENQTTPSNMAKLLQMIASDQLVNPQVSGDIRGLLGRNIDRSKLVRLLPDDAQVAHKSGWYDGVANDVGIVTVSRVPARWVIAVFAENVPDTETGNQLISAVSKAVYDAWAP